MSKIDNNEKKIGFIAGTFDLGLHAGHMMMSRNVLRKRILSLSQTNAVSF